MSKYYKTLDYTLADSFAKEALIGPTNSDYELGDAEANIINGNNNDNKINGMGGNDTINGRDGNDVIYGGNGNDILKGGAGDDKIYGGNGKDEIYSNFGGDDIFSGAGNDEIFINGDKTFVDGGSGTNIILADGENQNHYFWAGEGITSILDEGGDDILQLGNSTWDDLVFSRLNSGGLVVSTVDDLEDNNRIDNYVVILDFFIGQTDPLYDFGTVEIFYAKNGPARYIDDILDHPYYDPNGVYDIAD